MYNNYSKSNQNSYSLGGYRGNANMPPSGPASNFSYNTTSSRYHNNPTNSYQGGNMNLSSTRDYSAPYPATNMGANNTDGDIQSIRSSGLMEKNSNLRNQFMSNTNPSTDNIKYNRLNNYNDNTNDPFNDDESAFDFVNGNEAVRRPFIGNNAYQPDQYEMSNLRSAPRPESPPLPPSPQNPFNTEEENHDYSQYQHYPYNGASKEVENPFEPESSPFNTDKAQPPIPDTTEEDLMRRNERSRLKQLRSKPRFHYTRLPYFGILVTLIQIIVFIVELVKMSQLTGSAFQTKPYFNPMLGPSTYLIINMGARYVPCMNAIENISTDPSLNFPCPNSTDVDTNVCNLNELCGLSGIKLVDNEYDPNQWYRVITPIFLHAGFLHILFNLLLQVTMGFSIERSIGLIKYAFIYLISGAAGFLLGANFTPRGVASCGASGALFGIVATNFLVFLYAGKKNTNIYGTKRYGLFIVILLGEVIVSFVLGLLPGLDNFSHIGGFAAGLLTSIVLLKDPAFVYNNAIIRYQHGLSIWEQFLNNWNPMYNFESKIPRNFYIWCGVRVLALALLIVFFVLLCKNFFGKEELGQENSCKWCKYISCIPVNGWCDQGELTIQEQNTSSDDSTASATSSSSTPEATTPDSIDNQNYSGEKRSLNMKAFETFKTQETLPDSNTISNGTGIVFFLVIGLIALRFIKTRKRLD